MRAEEVWPTQTTAEIVLRVGDQTSFLLDHDGSDDAPPCLYFQDGPVQVLLYPLGWVELGQVTDADVERAGDLVASAIRWRDAISRRLAEQRACKAAPVRQVEVSQPGVCPGSGA